VDEMTEMVVAATTTTAALVRFVFLGR